MASMADNPLIGEYTKGISRGPAYFKALERRAYAEKAHLLPIAKDLQMGLFNKATLARESSKMLTGLGRFGPKVTETTVTKVAKKAARSQWKVVSMGELSLFIK